MPKSLARPVALVAIAVAVSGCSMGSMLNGKGTATQAARVPVGNELALPPDLALNAPGETTDAYVPNGPVEGIDDDLAAPGTATAARAVAPAAPRGDNYEKYGISKTNPDGSPKTPQQLSNELKKAMLAEKRKNNPGYGTIRNIGSIFSDG